MKLPDKGFVRQQQDRIDALKDQNEKLIKALEYFSNAKRRTVFDVLPENNPTKEVLMIEADNEKVDEALRNDLGKG